MDSPPALDGGWNDERAGSPANVSIISSGRNSPALDNIALSPDSHKAQPPAAPQYDLEYLSRFQSSFETNHWSDNNIIWRSHDVEFPRLNTPDDEKVGWDVTNYPQSIDDFLGTPNTEVKRSLNTLVANAQIRNVLFHGTPGSGKTALMMTFIKEFYNTNLTNGLLMLHDCVFKTTGEAVVVNIKTFKKEVEHWKKKLDHKVKKIGVQPPLKAIVIDDIHRIPPANQQEIRRMMDMYAEDNIRFVFSALSPKSLIEGIRSQAYILKLARLPEVTMLKLSLSCLVRERIGYEKDGIELLYKYTGEDLGQIFRTIQKIFTTFSYLSYENVMKITFPELAKKPAEVPFDAVLQPIPRCKLCLLPPPCQHISPFALAQQARARRRELPKWPPGSMTCARFKETGTCLSFNSLGRCSCNHPLDVHTINYPQERCPVCSLPKPCNKCEYTHRRAELQKFVEASTAKMPEYQKLVEEVEELGNHKIRAGGGSDAVNEGISERIDKAKDGIEQISVKLEQISRYLANNPDSIDNAAYKTKLRWITTNVETAHYAVDRALFEWRSKREDKKKGLNEVSLESSAATGRSRKAGGRR
jgi:DNA polymerase III delta prime subunit